MVRTNGYPSTNKKKDFLACAIHHDFHIPTVIRYVGGRYTRADRDVPKLLKNICGKVPHTNYAEVVRVLTIGSPAYIYIHSSTENVIDYWRYGNHASVLQKKPKIEKFMAKENEHAYVMPFPS